MNNFDNSDDFTQSQHELTMAYDRHLQSQITQHRHTQTIQALTAQMKGTTMAQADTQTIAGTQTTQAYSPYITYDDGDCMPLCTGNGTYHGTGICLSCGLHYNACVLHAGIKKALTQWDYSYRYAYDISTFHIIHSSGCVIFTGNLHSTHTYCMALSHAYIMGLYGTI